MNKHITITQSFRDATRRYGFLGAVLFPLALVKVIFTN